MSNVKISALPAATTPLTGTELVPLVQSGVTSQVAVSNIKTAPAGSNTQVQFNNSSAFGASASLTWDGTSLTATKLAGAHNGTVGATTPSTGAFTTVTTTTSVAVGGSTLSGSGSGVQFPATQSASTDANTLDDYEEGTWTPSLGGIATYTSRTGSYTKIGRFVYVTVAMAINVIGTGSTFRISGLPFNAGVATGASGSVAYAAALSQNVVSFTVGVNAGDIDVYTMLAANTASSNNSIFGNTTTIQLSATYYV